jgi:hypothetical protein
VAVKLCPLAWIVLGQIFFDLSSVSFTLVPSKSIDENYADRYCALYRIDIDIIVRNRIYIPANPAHQIKNVDPRSIQFSSLL